jgi:hypothetical protein
MNTDALTLPDNITHEAVNAATIVMYTSVVITDKTAEISVPLNVFANWVKQGRPVLLPPLNNSVL